MAVLQDRHSQRTLRSPHLPRRHVLGQVLEERRKRHDHSVIPHVFPQPTPERHAVREPVVGGHPRLPVAPLLEVIGHLSVPSTITPVSIRGDPHRYPVPDRHGTSGAKASGWELNRL